MLALIVSLLLRLTPSWISVLTAPLHPFSFYVIWSIRAVLLMNVAIALFPLFKPKDDLSDIPLTPSQRYLLGLDPKASTPLTPGSHYVTPPRYPRSASRSGTPGSHGTSYSNSPLSGKGSSIGRVMGGPQYSPISPLLQKAMGGGGRDLNRRSSYGSPSLGSGLSSSLLMDMPATPSPVGGKGVSVPLNNRWLYERNRGSPAGSKLFS